MPSAAPKHRQRSIGAPVHKATGANEGDSWRAGRKGSAARGYGYRWQQARAGWLRAHPLCVECKANGWTTAATEVDHIIPHRGDMVLFWDAKSNWQSLCEPHHKAKTARGE